MARLKIRESKQVSRLCFLDVETTGASIGTDYAIYIGAILVDAPALRPVKEFLSYIRPPAGAKNTKVAERIHGIDLASLASAPAASEVIFRFIDEFGTEFAFAGWNVCFDVSFFRKLFVESRQEESFHKFGHRHLDVQSVIRGCVDKGLIGSDVASLDDALGFAGYARPSIHNPLEDARAALDIYRWYLQFEM